MGGGIGETDYKRPKSWSNEVSYSESKDGVAAQRLGVLPPIFFLKASKLIVDPQVEIHNRKKIIQNLRSTKEEEGRRRSK